MSCLHCDSAHQRGRFCNRCGRKRTPATPAGRVLPARRPSARGGSDTRNRTHPAPIRPDSVPVRNRSGAVEFAADTETAAPNPAVIHSMYDAAMARVANEGELPLERYESVLLAAPRSAGAA
jgi:hypothetical protein